MQEESVSSGLSQLSGRGGGGEEVSPLAGTRFAADAAELDSSAWTPLHALVLPSKSYPMAYYPTETFTRWHIAVPPCQARPCGAGALGRAASL